MSFAENIQRYRQIAAQAVGGTYGQRRAVSLGHHPTAPGIIFFDDGVTIDSTQGSTNLYNAGSWNVDTLWDLIGIKTGPTFTSEAKKECFLKLAEPITEIAELSIGSDGLLADISRDTGFVGDNEFDVFMHYNLILVPFTGANALATITFNTHNWTDKSAGHGTFYGTPSNFDASAAGTGYPFRSFGIAGSDLWEAKTLVTGSVIGVDAELSTANAHDKFSTTYPASSPAKPSGVTIHGIHLFLTDSAGEGIGNNQLISTLDPTKTTDLNFEFNTANTRSAASNPERKSYVLNSGNF